MFLFYRKLSEQSITFSAVNGCMQPGSMKAEGNQVKEYITYEMFGAAGDGVQDDMPAIVKAHAAANEKNLTVKAREGAVYYISPRDQTAIVQTNVDWNGAEFVIDDVHCERITAPVFHVVSRKKAVPLQVDSMAYGQTELENPFGCDLQVIVQNANHRDYIRKGLNQDSGHTRTDVFILDREGRLSSPLSFDFETITALHAYPIDEEELTIQGGEFLTIANQAEAKYNYHMRNIYITRSHVDVRGITHRITGEGAHGAPYRGFITVENCARVHVHDCVFTGHFTYWTIGSANLPVPMGSYDISLNRTSSVRMTHCSQVNDIHDDRYWGLIGTNFCRDLVFDDCQFSRFDAHMGVSNCTLRRCRLGWQCLNAIGNGVFLIEETEAHGNAFVNLRDDYGCTWRGDIILRNCTWIPRSERRAVFSGHNDGTHDFGYPCYMPNVVIDGLNIVEKAEDNQAPVYVFNDYLGSESVSGAVRPFMPIPPKTVTVLCIRTKRPLALCENPALMPDTLYRAEGAEEFRIVPLAGCRAMHNE